jgi:hypothetical protein
MDHFTGNWYNIRVCDVCHSTNHYDRISEYNKPLALQNLIEVMKSQRTLVFENEDDQ